MEPNLDQRQTSGDPADLPPPGAAPEQEQSPIQFPAGMTEAWLVGECKRLEEEFKGWFQQYQEKIYENKLLYENKQAAGITSKDGPIIPKTTSIVDTHKARVMLPLFAQEKLFDLLPSGRQALQYQDAGDIAATVEDFLGEAVYDTPEFYQRMDVVALNLFLENCMMAYLTWHSEEEEYLQVSTAGGKTLSDLVATEQKWGKRTKGYPCFEPLTTDEMAFDPRCQFNMRKARWVRRRVNLTFTDLKVLERQKQLAGADELKAAANAAATGSSSTTGAQTAKDPQAQNAQRVEGTNLPKGSFDKDNVFVDVWFATLEWENEGKSEHGEFVFWLGNGEKVLRCKPNGSKRLKRPFLYTSLNQKVGGLMGQGPIDTVKALVKEIANTLAAERRLSWQAANSPIFYEPVTMLDGQRTILEGANLVPVLSSKGINRMDPPVAAIGLLRERLQFLLNQADQATAANEQTQGVQGNKDGTATEAQILAGSASIRIQYISNMVNAAFFAEMGGGYLELYREHGVEGEMAVREGGVDGNPVPITLLMLSQDYIIRPLGSMPEANKMNRFKLLSGALREVASIPPEALTDAQGNMHKVNTYDFLVKDVLPLIGVRGGQRLFTNLGQPAPRPMQGAQQGLQQEAQGMGGEAPAPMDMAGGGQQLGPMAGELGGQPLPQEVV